MFEVNGFFPEKIIIIEKPEVVVECWYGEKRKVKPVMVVDANNILALSKAVRWAGQGCKQTTVSNKHLTDFKIVNSEIRGTSTVYKVIDSNNYYFDLREDVLF